MPAVSRNQRVWSFPENLKALRTLTFAIASAAGGQPASDGQFFMKSLLQGFPGNSTPNPPLPVYQKGVGGYSYFIPTGGRHE